MKNIILKSVQLPDFGMSHEMPEIPASEYERRIAATVEVMNKRKIDVLLVFADREHFANFRFLTGLDPRFEESLLLLDTKGNRKILLGNECIGALGKSPVAFEYELFQDFSLMGQNRSRSRSLEEIFKEFGIGKNKKVDCTYYKYYSDVDGKINHTQLDIPAFIADLLRDFTGDKELVVNANDIFMESSSGLRHHICLEELVRFEWASTRTSESIKRLIQNIKPGKREYELAGNFSSDGLPLSCHPMLSSGEKAKAGLSSPSSNKVALGDPFTSAFGAWGALTCRAGMITENHEQLEKQVAVYYEKFWRNYFQTVVAWYEALEISVTGGTVWEKTETARDKTIFDFSLNTGHSIHLDEWVNSPFYSGSEIKLHSGLALQMDIIPANTKEFVAANAEDGVVLADENLRHKWSNEFPDSWKRIQQRRDFMINQLGINIKPDVLPLSNIPAYFAPYLLNPGEVAVVK